MDRPAVILRRWLTLSLVVPAWASLPDTALRAAAFSLSVGTPSVRIVFRSPLHAGMAPARKTPRRQSPPEIRGLRGPSPPNDRISMVLGPTSSGGEDAPERHQEAVTIRFHEPASLPPAEGPLRVGAAAAGAKTEPTVDPQPEQTTPQAPRSVAMEPAERLADWPPESPLRPQVDRQPEDPAVPPAQTDPDPVPDELTGESARRWAEPAVRPARDHLPEDPAAPVAKAAPDPVPDEAADVSAGRPIEPPAKLAPDRQVEAAKPSAVEPDPDPLPEQPAGASTEPPIEPPRPPLPDHRAKPGEPSVAETDGALVPAEPTDASAERPTQPPLRPGPDRLPEGAGFPRLKAEPHRAAQGLATTTPQRLQPLPPHRLGSSHVLPRDGRVWYPRTPPIAGQAGSLLLPPEDSSRRSEQMEQVAREADRQIRRGFELASRGAYFAARTQFIRALRLLGQGLDTEHQTNIHSRSLAVGLAAISEAEDFIPTGSRLEADLDVPAIIDGHRTPVLKNANTENLTPLSALTCYFTFAQEQLAAAAGREVAGSMALHALGKLHAALAGHNGGNVQAAESKAVAFYQAALLVYPRNYMAANDLGVLLARCGNYREAEAALTYSLSIDVQPTTWHNLAVVYRQLGVAAAARQADQLWQAARQAEIARRKALQTPSQHLVRWVDPSAFNRFRTNAPAVPAHWPEHVAPPADGRAITLATPAKPTESRQPTRAAQGSIMGWLPWRRHDQRR
jgi:tetratricopeptide (TPR) repeat protein